MTVHVTPEPAFTVPPALRRTAAALVRPFTVPAAWPILLATAILTAVGYVTIRSVAPASATRQAQFLVVAVVGLIVFQLIDYRRIGRWAWGILLLAVVLVGYTVLGSVAGGVPGVTARNGAYNWIAFGPASLQPSELVKIGYVLVLARYLRFRSNYRSLPGLIPPFLLTGVPVALILKQPDLGTALVFIPTLFAMLFAAGARRRHLAGVVGMGVAVAPLLWLSGTDVPVLRLGPEFVRGYQRERVYAMFNDDERTLQETGFQQHNALIAFGSGGVAGKGAGEVPIGSRVPEAHNDMIFALIGEQFGFFGSLTTLTAYGALFAAGLAVAWRTREPFGRLVAVGVVSILAAQTFLNVAVALKIMPVTGVTLPFVSAGGSSLIASYLAAGLLLNVGQRRPFVAAGESFEFDD